MADYNASVALGINPPDPQGGLNTLNKIMELGQRGLETTASASAAEHMQASSELFKVLRYEADLAKAGAVLEQIAAHEVAALDDMTRAWAEVKLITERVPRVDHMAAE